MKVCFVFSNRSEFSEIKPFVDYFKKKTKTDVLDLSKKIKKLELDENLSKIYSVCYSIFLRKKYDYICILGDRRELPFVAFSAFYLNIKIIHIAAGEYISSVTNFDQFIRPIISIMSNLQICFSKRATQEVNKLFSGISYLKPNAHFVGNPVFSGINFRKLKRQVSQNYDLVLLHPQSLSRENTKNDIMQLKKNLKNKKTIFILGNKDKNYDLINKFYEQLKSQNLDYVFLNSLSKEKYFCLVKYCDNFFTNTSSIYEIKLLNSNCLRIIGERNKNRSNEVFNNKAPEMLYKILKKKIEF